DKRATARANPAQFKSEKRVMSPPAALSDPVFRAYVGIALTWLMGAGAILALLRRVFRTEIGSVWRTYRSWLWRAPLAATVIFAGREPFIIGVAALAILAFKEFALTSGLDRDRWMIVTVSAGILAVGVAALLDTGLTFVALASLTPTLIVP